MIRFGFLSLRFCKVLVALHFQNFSCLCLEKRRLTSQVGFCDSDLTLESLSDQN